MRHVDELYDNTLYLSYLIILQVKRSGGSGGVTTRDTDAAFFQFMRNVKSSTPMISKAVKVVRKKFGYDVYYIGREPVQPVKNSHMLSPDREATALLMMMFLSHLNSYKIFLK